MLTSSCSSYRSYLSNWYTSITRSITLSPPSLALSLNILPISRLSIRGAVSSNSICHSLSLIPPLLAFIYYTILIALILSINKMMPSCSYCIKKGLVCIIITALSSRQPLSYAECIKLNIYLSCNICSISNTKYICYLILFSRLVPYLSYYRVLDSICR